MIDGNQLREEFGRYLAEHKATRWGMDAALMHVCKIAYDAGKADEQLYAHIQRGAVLEGWKEATIAWEVCASIHREYAKKKDPFFTTRQADFVKHTEAARSALLAAAPAPSCTAPAPAEVPMPQGYTERPTDYTGDIWIESQMRTYGAACRAAGEAAGYARGLREMLDCRTCRNYTRDGCIQTAQCVNSDGYRRAMPVRFWSAALRGEVKP